MSSWRKLRAGRLCFFFSSRRRHTRCSRDWSSDVCSSDLMATNHLTDAHRAASTLFLEGQGWGFGGSVDVESIDAWNVPGRYGWVGGTGTAAHVVPATGAVTILLTQVMMTGPTPTPLMRGFWRSAAR